jgi:hypothetical protein
MVTRNMADYTAIMRHLEKRKLPHFIYHPKPLRPVKAVIRHLPGDTAAEYFPNELVAFGISVISVRQLTATKQQPQGGNHLVNLPLFLVTLARNEKPPEIFKLTNFSHVIIKAEAYRAQAGLTQRYNCQQFGHVWANCRQQCSGGHVHKDFPDKGTEATTPNCCNCKQGEGVKRHPSNYRVCSHAKEELLRRRACESILFEAHNANDLVRGGSPRDPAAATARQTRGKDV